MIKAYSLGRCDRSGAQIHDLIFAYGYCEINGMNYLGARVKRHTTDVIKLINLLKLPAPFNECVKEKIIRLLKIIAS